MARSRIVTTAWAAACAATFLTALGAASSGSGRAAVAQPATSAKVRTLVTSQDPIKAFAQDGDRIAWISPGKHGGAARCALRIRDLRSGRTMVTQLGGVGCPRVHVAPGSLALAGRTAAWAQGSWGGNIERSWLVMRAVAGDRHAHTVDRADFYCTGSCESEYNEPLLAGAGRTIAYSYGVLGEVRRIVAGGVRRLFTTVGEVPGLTVAGGRVAAVSLTLGGGTGLLESPAWSPDGTKVAVAHGQFYTTEEDDFSVAVMNADGTGLRDLPSSATCQAGHYYVRAGLAWSPDGRKIASEDCFGRIRVAAADGSGDQVLADGGSPTWSPDGLRIAFARNSPTSAIYVMNADGSNIERLATFGSGADTVGPLAWSPDGTRIAFSLGGALEVMNADGGNPHRVGGATGAEPTWSPDSSRIAFRGTSGLFAVGADGSALRRLTSGPDDHPSWSPDGTTVVFARWAFTHNWQELMDLYAVDPDGGDLRPFDGVAPVEIASTTIVHSPKGRATFAAAGTPAGVALPGKLAAVGSVAAGDDRITLFDGATGKQVATVGLGADHGEFSVAGANPRWVVFYLDGRISALKIASRKIVTLARPAGWLLDLSVSGRRVAWLERFGDGRSRIRAVDLPS